MNIMKKKKKLRPLYRLCVRIVSNQHKNAKYKYYSAKTPDAFSLFTLEGLSTVAYSSLVFYRPITESAINIRICFK